MLTRADFDSPSEVQARSYLRLIDFVYLRLIDFVYLRLIDFVYLRLIDFVQVSDEDLRHLASSLKMTTLRPGEVLLSQGGDVKEVPERELFIDSLLVRIHFIIVMVKWTGLAP